MPGFRTANCARSGSANRDFFLSVQFLTNGGVTPVSEFDSQDSDKVSAGRVPRAEAGCSGWSESAEGLRTGDVDRRVGALEPACLWQIVGVEPERDSIALAHRNGLAQRHLGPPDGTGPSDSDARVSWGECRG